MASYSESSSFHMFTCLAIHSRIAIIASPIHNPKHPDTPQTVRPRTHQPSFASIDLWTTLTLGCLGILAFSVEVHGPFS